MKHHRRYHVHRLRRRYHHHGPRQHLTSIVIAVDGTYAPRDCIYSGNLFSLLWYYFINQGKDTEMLTLTVGHSAALSIQYLDQNGNPMLAPQTPDAPPTWANAPSAAGVDTFVANADGTASLSATAQGTDSVSVSVAVAGKTFTASLAVEVDPAPQVLTSVAINATVS